MTPVSDNQKAIKKQQNMPALIREIVAGIVKFWLVVLLVTCLLIGFILTPWGTQSLFSLANSRIDELTVDYQSGGVGSELHLSSVKWHRLGDQIDLDNLRLSIDLSCVWKFALCIDSVVTDKMQLRIQTSNSSPDAIPATSVTTLPFAVVINHLVVNQFSLKLQDTADISWKKLTGKLDFYQRLRIQTMQVHEFSLVTHSANKSSVATQVAPFDWTTWQYQPITRLPFVLPIYVDVLALNMSPASFHVAGQQEVKLNTISLKAKGSQKKLQVDELLIEHAQGTLLAKGNVLLNGLFEHELFVDANADLLEQTPLKFKLRSSGNIHALSTQVELIDTSLSVKTPPDIYQAKPLKLVVDLQAQLSKTTLPINLKINWSQLVWPLTEPALKSESGVIDINGDLHALNIRLQTMFVGQNIPDTKINLSAIAASTSQHKSFELNELLVITLGGQILSEGKLTFSDYINWQGRSTISHVDPSILWPQLIADINGEVLTQANNSQGIWKAKLNKLTIDGQWQGYPLSASGSINFHQNTGLQLHALSLKNAENILVLDGGVSKQKELDITFMLDAADLSNSLPQLGGSLNLAGIISGSTAQPELGYELLGNNLLVSDVLFEQAVGKGNIKWNEQKPMAFNLDLKGIQGINNQVDSATIVLMGDASDHQLDVTTTGQTSSVNLMIQGHINQTSWQGNWLSGDIKSSYANLTLPTPFKIEADWVKQQYIIAPHCWRHTENALCIQKAEFKNHTLAWDVSLREFDVLSVMQRLLPSIPSIQTKSRLNLDMSGDWDIEQLPNANISASLSSGDWVFIEQNNLQLSLNKTSVKAQITQKSIQGNIHLSGNKIGILSANIKGLSGAYADPLTRPIQGELLMEHFDLAALNVLVPQLDVLQGAINGQAQIDGTLGMPLLIGELKLSNGALKDESLPVALSAIEQRINLKGQRAEFKGSYMLGKGSGEMWGDVTWIPALKGNVHMYGEALEFDYQNMFKAKVSPNINIMFTPNNLEINGEVTIPYARFKVRDLPKGTISPSKDVILIEKQAELEASPQRLALNVLLTVDPLLSNEVKLDAFGLTTDLQGELRLQNNKSEIFGSGVVQLVNGRYRAYGQNLIIREGDILFTSTLDRPYLNVEAVRDPEFTSNGVVAGLRIQGAAQNPTLSVFSEPDMEQQQILSYMLTGLGMGESSGDSQDTILTNALLSLGLGQSENLINQVGNKLGFEDINLDTTGQGDGTQLSLSGTIAPGVQLRYGVGVFDSVSEVAIRYELIPKLYIEAVSGLSNAIDIYYQFNIEGSQNERFKND
jgi:translocation and assembly module TamB